MTNRWRMFAPLAFLCWMGLTPLAAAESKPVFHFAVSGAPFNSAIGSEAKVLRGAPVTVSVWAIGDDGAVPTPAEALQGIAFAVTRELPEGPARAEVSFRAVPSTHQTGVARGRARHSPEWYATTPLEPGRYVLRVLPPSGVELAPRLKDGCRFEILEPRCEDDRCEVMLGVVGLHMDMGEFELAEAAVFRVVDRFPKYPAGRVYSCLAGIYEAVGMSERAYEFKRASVAKNYWSITTSTNRAHTSFASKAVAAGVVKSEEEGIELFSETMRQAGSGEYTGELPEGLLSPVLGSPAAEDRGGWRRLIIGASVAGLLLLGAAGFLLLKRAKDVR